MRIFKVKETELSCIMDHVESGGIMSSSFRASPCHSEPIEDMMRILWPASQLSDILEMRRWCTEMANSLERPNVWRSYFHAEASIAC